MKTKFIFLLFSAGILLTSCEDDDVYTRPEDREDFHWSITKASINGQQWGDCQPSMFSSNNTSKSTAEKYSDSGFGLFALNICSNRSSGDTSFVDVGIRIDDSLEEGKTYILSTQNIASVSGWIGTSDHFIATTSDIDAGKLTITKFENNQISGTFYYVATLDSLNITVKVENGTFENMPVLNF